LPAQDQTLLDGRLPDPTRKCWGDFWMPGESVRFEVRTRADAESLRRALAEFAPVVARSGQVWVVEITPDRQTSPQLLSLFHAIGDWLVERGHASLHIHFGARSFTLLRPSRERPYHAAEFLLERVIQLQTALESRVVIEQAKGILAARLRLAVEDAFDILRRAARIAGRQLHELAREVVESEEIPEPIRHVLVHVEEDGGAAGGDEEDATSG
jgi:ANTAR domain